MSAARPLRYADLLAEARARVAEQMPWDVLARVQAEPAPLLVDVREPAEFARARIAGSVNVPRGVLEQACEWDHDETEPRLIEAVGREVVLVCRSGQRSLLAGVQLQRLGYTRVVSLRTGLRGWADAEQPLVDADGQQLDPDEAEARLRPHLRPDQRRPARG